MAYIFTISPANEENDDDISLNSQHAADKTLTRNGGKIETTSCCSPREIIKPGATHLACTTGPKPE